MTVSLTGELLLSERKESLSAFTDQPPSSFPTTSNSLNPQLLQRQIHVTQVDTFPSLALFNTNPV